MSEEAEDKWVLAEGMLNDQPIYMRILSEIPSSIVRADYPENLIVTWQYEAVCDGLPGDEDVARMNQMEDLLMSTLTTAHNQSHLLVVTTAGSTRQWLWKTRSAEDAVGMFGEALGGHPPFPIEISADDDPEWNIYQHYLEQSGA